MRYGFHPEARLEYREAAVFYEARRLGLGAAFTREIEAAIERILEAPDRWRFVEQDVRRCLAHTFPYGIFYTVEDEFILIVAVAHSSREPGYWRHRLEGSAEHLSSPRGQEVKVLWGGKFFFSAVRPQNGNSDLVSDQAVSN